MILVLTEDKDTSANKTIEWFCSLQIPHFRINLDNANMLEALEISKDGTTFQLKYAGQQVEFNEITAVWFRRGYFHFGIHRKIFEQIEDEKTRTTIKNHIREECTTLTDFLYYKLGQLKSVNHPNAYNMNKLIALELAQKAGFDIPSSGVFDHKNKVQRFEKAHGALISKNIQDVISLKVGNFQFGHYTVPIEDLQPLSESFFYSFFQEKIDKKYELRIFVWENEIYAGAIFSQASDSTQNDSRLNNDFDNPPRIVPYQVHDDLRNKILRFMEYSALESGSIDIIVTHDLRFIFLEVNPVGQYDYINVLCNYQIDKKIAESFKYKLS